MATDKTEKVLASASQVFVRHGFKRVTMGDIAEAAGMSRPALYLVFDSKEAVFKAALNRHFEQALAEIRAGLPARDGLQAQLLYALDVWCVRPFEMTLASPDAKDLLESGYLFAGDVVATHFDTFEKLLARSIKPHLAGRGKLGLSAPQIAHIVVHATTGFKSASPTAARLRQMIAGLITLVLGNIGA